MKSFEKFIAEKRIKAPSNVLQTDMEYALGLYMRGEISLKDLKDTNGGNLKNIASAKDIEQLIKNKFMLRMQADEHNTDEKTIIKQATELLNAIK